LKTALPLCLLLVFACGRLADSANDKIPFNTSPPERVFPKQAPSLPIPDWSHAQTSRDLLETEKIVKLEMNQDSVIGKISFLARIGDNWCILDDEQRRVLRFDAAGHYLDTVGARGQGPGEYEWPCSLSRWGENLVVADRMKKRLLLYNADGKFVNAFTTANLGITLNNDLQFTGQRLFIADVAARHAQVPWHLILDVSQPDWKILWGFGKRFAYPKEKKEIQQVAFTAFAKVDDMIWTGSPYSSEVEVYDLDGRFLGSLQPGFEGLKEEDLLGKGKLDYLRALGAKPANFEIVALEPYVLLYFQKGRMTVYEDSGHLVKANLKAHAFHYIVPTAIDGSLVTVVDFGFLDPKFLEQTMTEREWRLLSDAGYNPDDRDNDNPYLVVSRFR